MQGKLNPDHGPAVILTDRSPRMATAQTVRTSPPSVGADVGGTLADALAGKANALNVLRLAFAALVIVSHSWALTGRTEPSYGGLTLGAWAVAGFFGISGYLIPRARLRTDLPTFLLRRARRIYPGFWVCCVVVAFLAAPAAAHLVNATYNPAAGAGYVFRNATTWIAQEAIGPAVDGPPTAPAMMNPPVWTLAFELMCYALAGALLTLDVIRRHTTSVAVAVYAASTVATVRTEDGQRGVWFIALFAAGWIISTVSDRLVASSTTGLAALVAALGLALVHPVLAVVPLAYAVLCAGALLPCRWFTTHDVSYGTYLYGWPIQQLLVALGVTSLMALVPMAIALALAAGTASWFLVERRCLHR